MAKLTQLTDLVEYDSSTGEIKSRSESRVFNMGAEPDFIKLYLQDVLYLSDMPTQYSDVLLSLLKRVTYASDEYGMCVVLVPGIKDAVCDEVGFKKRQSLDNVLQKFVKGKILYRVGRGIYRLNPYLFGRGTWSDISRLRLEISYDLSGRTFSTVVNHKSNNKKAVDL